MRTYQIGERPTFVATFNDEGVPTSPTDGEWKLEEPDGSETVYDWSDPAITFPSAGVVEFTPSVAFGSSGIWTVRAEGTATVLSAWEEAFEVLPSAFGTAVTSRYCAPTDLLVGDLTVSPAMLLTFVNSAADEIDAEIGFDYVTPIVTTGLPTHVVLTLKRCNVLIATGRFIMAQAVGGEDVSTHAYGQSLLKEGQAILKAICTGQIDLTGAAKHVVAVTGNAPSIIQGDASSGVDAYYAQTGPTAWSLPSISGYSDFWGPG